MAAPDPSHIMQVGMGFWASKTLLSAVELGLFTELARRPQTGAELAKSLGLHARAVPGLLSCTVAAAHPKIRCTSFDLPAVEPIAARSIAKAGLSDRVKTAKGDFFADSLPRADVVTMGMILHDWNLEKKKVLIRKA